MPADFRLASSRSPRGGKEGAAVGFIKWSKMSEISDERSRRQERRDKIHTVWFIRDSVKICLELSLKIFLQFL